MLCYIPNNRDLWGKRVDTYDGIEVMYRTLDTCSKESLLVEKTYGGRSKKTSNEEIKKMTQLVNTATYELMSKHSNITMIRISHTKSIGFSKGDHKHEDEVCVVIYTRAKSYVPLGEPLFPEYVEAADGSKMKTDVREGYFLLCPNGGMNYSEPATEWQRELRLGQSIGSASNPDAVSFSGTLGPLVTVEEDNKEPYVAFLTASHLYFDRPENIKSAIDINVFQPADDDVQSVQLAQDRLCGVVKQCIFNDESSIGIDVALVKIAESRRPTRVLFSHVFDKALKDAGFSPSEMPTYDDGSVINADEIDPDKRDNGRVVKFGKKTGLTVSSLRSDVANITVDSLTLGLPSYPEERKYIMTGQLQINSSLENMFFQAGDSGAAVFFANKNENNLHLIGMAIGMTSDGYCLMTPAEAIFNELNKQPRVKIKPFVPEVTAMPVD